MENNTVLKRIYYKNFYKSVVVLICTLIFVFFIWSAVKPEVSRDLTIIDVWKFRGFKTILAYEMPRWFEFENGPEMFTDLKCPVNKCSLTTKHTDRQNVDLVLFHEHYISFDQLRPPNQIYSLFYLESPFHTSRFPYPDIINWTVSYRHDSTIPSPYRKWVYYDENIAQIKQNRNYAANKTKKVAWFVSNCQDKNGRIKYAKELQKYIQVDIYGECGSLSCSRETTDECFEMLDEDYKFYLAFENSNCVDYITEKFFENSLQHSVLPIVMGAPPQNYERDAPKRSFIHTDEFESPKELADYLHDLDQNDELYNSYFQWKGSGEVEYSQNYFCELCAMLHDTEAMSAPRYYEDINKWWWAPGICTTGPWRDLDFKNDPFNSSNRQYQCQSLYLCISIIVSLHLVKFIGRSHHLK